MPDYSYRPKKSLGQNFIKDENIIRKFISFLSLHENDYVLEIGAGQGILTKYIVPRVKNFIAVEIDKNLCHILQSKFNSYQNFQLIEDDFLKLALVEILVNDQKWKIVGNIPYHLTSPIIFKIFNFREHVQSLTLTIQREVAERITAAPNSKNYGILSVLSYLYADVKILFRVSRHVFSPEPKVDSAVVQWFFLPQPRYQVVDADFFIELIRTLFQQRRKMIKNSLKSLLENSSNICFQTDKRPEQLSVSELAQLSNLITDGRKRP